jgi:hypothetical protein
MDPALPIKRRFGRRLLSALAFMGFALACILAVFGIYLAKIELRAAQTTGQVIRVETHADGSTVPTIRFTAQDGASYQFTGLERDTTPWREGEMVTVRYDLQYPRDAHTDDALSRWGIPAMMIVAAFVLGLPRWLQLRHGASPRPVFRRQAEDPVRLSSLVWVEQSGGGRALRQLIVTEGRIVLGQVQLFRLIIHCVLAIVLATQLLSLMPAVPVQWHFAVAIAVVLAEAYRLSRRPPILADRRVQSIRSLQMTGGAQWWRSKGVLIGFDDGQRWTLYSAQKGVITTRPYAEQISAVSGRALEG